MATWARTALTSAVAGVLLSVALATTAPAAVTVPPNFALRSAFTGLVQPTSVRFAPNGLVFVAERRGTIQVFSGLGDTTPTQVVNLRREVFGDGDRGLLGLAVDPDLDAGRPFLYALYSRNATLGAPNTVPAWGAAGGGDPDTTDSDYCATLYDQTTGCEISGRLVRIPVDPATGVATGAPQTILDGWCQQFSTHSVGDLAWGAGRTLYVSGGDGAGYDNVDIGQFGNVCGDPPGDGGALRSQDLRTPFTGPDPTGYSGSLLRIDPDTGSAAAGNPLLSGSSDPTGAEQRILAYGLRNPFRFALRPNAVEDDVWVGDVGWSSWEELDRVSAPFGSALDFGWPCYEGDWNGSAPNWAYRSAAPARCGEAALPSAAVTQPAFSYFHTADEGQCFPTQYRDGYDPPATTNAGSAITGVAFYPGGTYPDEYRDGLFFGDYARGCLWFMPATAGVPDRSKVRPFAQWDASDPFAPEVGLVGLERGPGGDLFLVDMANGRIDRLQYGAAAELSASVSRGASPLPVTFSAAASSVPGGQTVTGYDWDFDGDGVVDDHTATPETSHTYSAKGRFEAKVTVQLSGGDVVSSDAVVISVDPPTAVAITTPADPSAVRWSVGDQFGIAGSAVAGGSGTPLGGDDLEWDLVIRHCAEKGDCHSHQADSQLSGLGPGNRGAAGVLTTPDHAYPSHVELRLTAHDPAIPELTTSTTMRLDPATVTVRLESDPAGRTLTGNATSGVGPIICVIIRRSVTSVAAAERESADGRDFVFDAWSDAGELQHLLRPEADTALTARYIVSPRVVARPPLSGAARVGSVLTAGEPAFDGSPVTVARRWERCTARGCAPIPGADASMHRVGADDLGARLQLRITGTNAAGSAEAVSEPSAVVAAAAGPAVRRGRPVRASRDGRVPLRVACPKGRRCRVSLWLRLERQEKAGATLGRLSPVVVAAGRARTVRVPLTRAAKALLNRRRTLTVRSTMTRRAGSASVQVTETRFTLLAARRR